MRFRGCFRQCNGKIPLKLNGRPHFCRRSIVLAFCGSPCRVCAGRKPGRSPIAPPGRSWRPFCRRQPPLRAAGAPLLPRKPAKRGPPPASADPLQTAGFSPQGRRRSGASPAPASGTNLSHRHLPQHRLQLPALQRRCQRRPGQGKLRRQTGRLF